MSNDDLRPFGIIRIEIPGPPTAKGRPKIGRWQSKDGRSGVTARTPEKTVNAEAFVKTLAMKAMAGRPPIEGPVRMRLFAYLPIAPSWSKKKQEQARSGKLRPLSKPDWDNFGKLVSDAGNRLIWIDDSQIVDVRVIKAYADVPCTIVEIIEL